MHAASFSSDSQLGMKRYLRIVIFLILFGTNLLQILKLKIPKSKLLLYYFLYFLFCLASSTYSPFPQESMWKSFELLVYMSWTAVVIQKSIIQQTPHNLLYGTMYLLFALEIFGVVSMVLFPDVAFRISESGKDVGSSTGGSIIPYVNANTLTQIGGTVFLVLFLYMLDKKQYRIPVVLATLISFIVMILSHSRTSIFATAILLCLLLIKDHKKFFVFSVPVIFLLVAYGSTQFVVDYMSRGQSSKELMSMTGRAWRWEIGWDVFLNNPWFGTGYYSGHKAVLSGEIKHLSTLDNTYLDSLVDIGILGTSWLFIFHLYLLYKVIIFSLQTLKCSRTSEKTIHNIPLIIFSFLTFRTMTGPSFHILNMNLHLALTCVAFLEAHLYLKKRLRVRTGSQ